MQRNAGRIRLRGICARKHAQGVPPRSEIHYVTARSGGDIMNSMRLRPPRPPGERASRERQPTEILYTAEKVSVFGAKNVCLRAARHDSAFAFPSEGKVPEGRMRCRLRVAEPFTNEKVTLCFVTRCRATPHQSADADSFPSRGSQRKCSRQNV